MATSDVSQQVSVESQRKRASGIARDVGRVSWQAIRIPVFAFLAMLEPVVRFVLLAAALLGVLIAFLFEFSGAAPRFPFWTVLGLSVGCGVLLMFYHALMRRFAR